MKNKLFWCKQCLNNSYRPRITFDPETKLCNGCMHHRNKFNGVIDWEQRRAVFRKICESHKQKGISYNLRKPDVICPCSGGKDSSYIADKLKKEFGLKVLLVSCRPLIQARMGWRNLENLILSGFDHIRLSPNPEEIRLGAKEGFITQGRPWHVFDSMLSASISKLAIGMGIDFMVFAEDGEEEYGGWGKSRDKFDTNYLLNAYYSGHDPSGYGYWWRMPTQDELDKLFITHWSKFFDFDGDVHARYCQEELGFEMLVGGNIGTFTNYDSLDDHTRDLHIFLSFPKFGTARCVQMASTEIRRNRMTREQGIEVCKKLDGQFPLEFLPAYLDYFEMSEGEFWKIADRFADYDIVYKTGIPEQPYRLKDEYANYDTFMPDGCDGVNFERGKFSSV